MLHLFEDGQMHNILIILKIVLLLPVIPIQKLKINFRKFFIRTNKNEANLKKHFYLVFGTKLDFVHKSVLGSLFLANGLENFIKLVTFLSAIFK